MSYIQYLNPVDTVLIAQISAYIGLLGENMPTTKPIRNYKTEIQNETD